MARSGRERRAMVGASVLVASMLSVALSAGCSGGSSHDAAAPAPEETAVVTEPPTTPAPTTTVAPTTTPAPTTVPPTTIAPTTTIDEAAKRFYEQFGGTREGPTPLPDPHRTGTQAHCTVVPGGYGVDGTVPWSDGVIEIVSSPGPFTKSATHVAVGSRGSWADIIFNGPTCLASIPIS